MALNKDQLRAKMQANSPTTNRTVTAIPLTNLTGAKPNGRTVQTTTLLKGVNKHKRAKDGVQNTSRYSFEITTDLKSQLERAVLEHQLNTGKKVSTSAVIRTAIEKYLKTGKL